MSGASAFCIFAGRAEHSPIRLPLPPLPTAKICLSNRESLTAGVDPPFEAAFSFLWMPAAEMEANGIKMMESEGILWAENEAAVMQGEFSICNFI